MAKKASKKKSTSKKKSASKKKPTAKKKSAKKSAKKPVKKAATKKKSAAKKKPAKKSAKKSTKKSAIKKSATKKKSAAKKKPAKKSAAKKKSAKKSTKKPAAKKSASKKKPAAKKSSAKKSAKKKATGKGAAKKKAPAKATKKKSNMGKKSSSSKKAGVKRTAKKLSNKGVLIKLKRDKGGAEEEGKPRRVVKAVEKSHGETPVTLHHRKPTKKEAEMFRQLLIVRRAQLMGDVSELQNEAFSDETQHVSTNHLADGAFEQYEQEFNISMIENETEELKEISRAIEKIERGEFGVCESCGIDISIERLKVMPYTRICIHCREEFEERGGGEEYGVYPERRI